MENTIIYDLKNRTHRIVSVNNTIDKCEFISNSHVVVSYIDSKYEKYASIYNLYGEKTAEVTDIDSTSFEVAEDMAVISNYDAICFLSSDGTVSKWIPEEKKSEKTGMPVKGYFGESAVSENGLVVALLEYSSKENIVLYDTVTGETITLDTDSAKIDLQKKNIYSFVWLSDGILGVLFKDNNTIYRFRTENGAYIGSIFPETPRIISSFMIDDECMGVVCADSNAYKIDLNTGEICAVLNLANESIKSAQKDSGKAEYIMDKGLLIFNWENDHTTYIIKPETFEMMYAVENCYDYSSSLNALFINKYNVAGYCPLYTPEQLVQKGEAFLNRQ